MYVVDLFCGCGGFSYGAKKAGHTVVLAIDNWDIAIEAHKYNHPDTAHYLMDLGKDLITVKRLIYKHIPKGSRWHLHGSPPCQSLSIANRLKGNIDKGMILVEWYLRLVYLCKPTSWSMEQVIAAKHRLEHVNVPKYIVNTSVYGVAQTRKRLFMGEGWKLPENIITLDSNALIDKIPYLKDEGIVYVKGYSGTRSVTVNGKHIGNVKLQGLQGFREVDRPTYTLCATGPLGLYDKGLNRVRAITIREALIIQGFPADFLPSSIKKKGCLSFDRKQCVTTYIVLNVEGNSVKQITKKNDFINTYQSLRKVLRMCENKTKEGYIQRPVELTLEFGLITSPGKKNFKLINVDNNHYVWIIEGDNNNDHIPLCLLTIFDNSLIGDDYHFGSLNKEYCNWDEVKFDVFSVLIPEFIKHKSISSVYTTPNKVKYWERFFAKDAIRCKKMDFIKSYIVDLFLKGQS